MVLTGPAKAELKRRAKIYADDICEQVEHVMGLELPEEKYHNIAAQVEADFVEAVEEAWQSA